jgi:hypothetical protein
MKVRGNLFESCEKNIRNFQNNSEIGQGGFEPAVRKFTEISATM